MEFGLFMPFVTLIKSWRSFHFRFEH